VLLQKVDPISFPGFTPIELLGHSAKEYQSEQQDRSDDDDELDHLTVQLGAHLVGDHVCRLQHTNVCLQVALHFVGTHVTPANASVVVHTRLISVPAISYFAAYSITISILVVLILFATVFCHYW